MSIRKRMLYLMLSVGLLPLILVLALYVTSVQWVGHKITQDIEQSLDRSSKLAMQRIMGTYQAWLSTNRQLINVLLEKQVGDVEALLRAKAPHRQFKKELKQSYAKIDRHSWGLTQQHFTYLFHTMSSVRATGIHADGEPQYRKIKDVGMYRFSLPVRNNEGQILGFTGFFIQQSDIFLKLKPLKEWEEGATGLLVYFQNKQLLISSSRQFGKKATIASLPGGTKFQGVAPKDLQKLKEKLRQTNDGVLRMPYKGKDSLWVYSGKKVGRVYPIMIVPYQNITQLSSHANALILKQNTTMYTYTTALMLILIIAAVFFALRYGKQFTQPIVQLAEGITKIAQGDFQAQVNINTGDELEQLGKAVNNMGNVLKEGEKMRGALALASAIQGKLLPNKSPAITGFDIAGRCAYCDETGGDYYDFINLSKISHQLTGVALGDITGHGIGAALLMASARSHFRHYAKRQGLNLQKVFQHFNNALFEDTQSGKFMSMFYGVIQPHTAKMNWISAGHDPAFILTQNSKTVKELTGPTSGGLLLGINPGETYQQGKPFEFQIGDIVIIGTDGIWEARNKHNKMFGKDRLKKVILQHQNKNAQELSKAIVDAVIDYCQGEKQQDDITVVVIKRTS